MPNPSLYILTKEIHNFDSSDDSDYDVTEEEPLFPTLKEIMDDRGSNNSEHNCPLIGSTQEREALKRELEQAVLESERIDRDKEHKRNQEQQELQKRLKDEVDNAQKEA